MSNMIQEGGFGSWIVNRMGGTTGGSDGWTAKGNADTYSNTWLNDQTDSEVRSLRATEPIGGSRTMGSTGNQFLDRMQGVSTGSFSDPRIKTLAGVARALDHQAGVLEHFGRDLHIVSTREADVMRQYRAGVPYSRIKPQVQMTKWARIAAGTAVIIGALALIKKYISSKRQLEERASRPRRVIRGTGDPKDAR